MMNKPIRVNVVIQVIRVITVHRVHRVLIVLRKNCNQLLQHLQIFDLVIELSSSGPNPVKITCRILTVHLKTHSHFLVWTMSNVKIDPKFQSSLQYFLLRRLIATTTRKEKRLHSVGVKYYSKQIVSNVYLIFSFRNAYKIFCAMF